MHCYVGTCFGNDTLLMDILHSLCVMCVRAVVGSRSSDLSTRTAAAAAWIDEWRNSCETPHLRRASRRTLGAHHVTPRVIQRNKVNKRAARPRNSTAGPRSKQSNALLLIGRRLERVVTPNRWCGVRIGKAHNAVVTRSNVE